MTDEVRTLVLLRHAKSDWSEDVPDAQRPLAKRGRRDAPVAGRWLRGHVSDIELVVHSPAVRAMQTWDLVASELESGPRVHADDQLYEASAEDLLAVTRTLPDGAHTVLFVGHNPGLEDLVGLLTGITSRMKTSGIAVLSGRGRWSAVGPGWASMVAEETPRGA